MNAAQTAQTAQTAHTAQTAKHSARHTGINPASQRPFSLFRSGGLCAISAVLSVCAAAAMAVANTPSADIEARYQAERATCMSGSSNQDRSTCLKEAGAARDEARKGQLSDGAGMLRQNAKQRCDALSGDEARDCMARMKGKGTTSGSAQAGGILRETVTRETHTVETPMPAASAP